MSVKYRFICNYCGHYWNREYFYIPDFAEEKCEKCSDTDIKKVKLTLDYSDPFGYNIDKLWKRKEKKSDK